MKKKLSQWKRDFLMFLDYCNDFKIYRKSNFGNYKNNNIVALEAKIRRQMHIIEKGMSLSNPRIGFGQEKIKVLFEYMDEYIKLGYGDKSNIISQAVGTLKAYLAFFRPEGYTNEQLAQKIETYTVYNENQECGIKVLRLEELKKAQHGEFPEFFLSRHSIRQFLEKEVELSVIKKAVAIAMNSPSACNRQSAKVYVYLEKEINDIIGQNLLEGSGGFCQEVNKYLVITGDCMAFTDSYERNQCIIDASLFAMNLVLALHYYGVGSCLLQASERKKLNTKRHKLLDIPNNERIVLVIAIGYYKDEFRVAQSQRKDIEEYLKIK